MEKVNNSDITELSGIINRNFSEISPEFLLSTADIKSIEEMKRYLSAKINILLEEKYDSLINILYRIDVDDKKLEGVFSSGRKENIPDKIADLIIERQLQKIHYRKMYKEGKL
ncbi:MAG: hypothetical protein P8Z35_08200 [Ignavibacteriaceae bacterium]